MVVLAGRFPPVVNMLIFMLLFIINAMSLLSNILKMTWALMVASSSQLLVKAPPPLPMVVEQRCTQARLQAQAPPENRATAET